MIFAITNKRPSLLTDSVGFRISQDLPLPEEVISWSAIASG